MNFEPPDFGHVPISVDSSIGMNQSNALFYRKPPSYTTSSPRSRSPRVKINKNDFNINNHVKDEKFSVQDRLGYRHYPPKNDDSQGSTSNRNNYQWSDTFNNNKTSGKRNGNNSGPIISKKRWTKRQTKSSSIQNRLHEIRKRENNRYFEEGCVQFDTDLQDVDTADLTIEVQNTVTPKNQVSCPQRFRMVLNDKVQMAIKVLQSKRTDKPIIFPFPVTPNATGISTNERFGLLL